jgi:hypothetical protein
MLRALFHRKKESDLGPMGADDVAELYPLVDLRSTQSRFTLCVDQVYNISKMFFGENLDLS